jgi:hypothetical protein
MYEGAQITTIEGLAKDGTLHPLQQAFIDHDAFQCGYCTPGQICSGVGLIADQVLQSEPSPSRPTEYLVDMQMMAMFGSARERNREEFAGMLSQAGLELRRVIPTRSPVSIVEAIVCSQPPGRLSEIEGKQEFQRSS